MIPVATAPSRFCNGLARWLIVLISLTLVLPPPAYALRAEADRAGLEDALGHSPAAGLEEAVASLRRHVVRMGSVIEGQRWAEMGTASRELMQITADLYQAAAAGERRGDAGVSLRQLDAIVQRLQLLPVERWPQDATIRQHLRRWHASAVAVLATTRRLTRPTAEGFVNTPDVLEGHLWFTLDMLWGRLPQQQVFASDEPPRETWLDALQVLIWTTPRNRFDPTQVNVDGLLDQVTARTLPFLLTQYGGPPAPGGDRALPSIKRHFQPLVTQVGSVPSALKADLLLRQPAAVWNLSAAFYDLVTQLAGRTGLDSARTFFAQRAAERYRAARELMDSPPWKPTFATGLEEGPTVPPLYPIIQAVYPYTTWGEQAVALAFDPVQQVMLFGQQRRRAQQSDILKHAWAFSLASGESVPISENIRRGLLNQRWTPEQAVFSPDGRTLFLRLDPPRGRDWQRIVAYDWHDGHRIGREIRLPDIRDTPGSHSHWRDIAISPDGKILYALSSPLFSATEGHFIRVFNPQTGRQLGQDIPIAVTDPMQGAWPVAILPNPDGRRLHVYCSHSQEIRTYDAATRHWADSTFRVEVPHYGFRGFSLSADGKILYVGSLLREIVAYRIDAPHESSASLTRLFPYFLATDAEGVLTVVSTVLTRGVYGLEIARSVPPARGPIQIEFPQIPGPSTRQLPPPTAGLEEGIQVRVIAEVLRHADPVVRAALLKLQGAGQTDIVLVPAKGALATAVNGLRMVADPELIGGLRTLVPEVEVVDQFEMAGQAAAVALRAEQARPALPANPPPILIFDPSALLDVNGDHLRALLAQAETLRGRTVDLTRGPVGTIVLDGHESAIYA